MIESQSESSIARTIECQDWQREILRSAQNDKRFAKGFAEGKRTMPGPGINAIAFRHCEERPARRTNSLAGESDEAISKRAA